MTPIRNLEIPLDAIIIAGEYRIHARFIVYIHVEADKDELTIYFESGDSLILNDLEGEIYPFVSQYIAFLRDAGVSGWEKIQTPPS